MYYNRFRYYSPNEGIYISQDPIRLAGSNPNFYAYTFDSNSFIDPLGLSNDPLALLGGGLGQ
ncbi:RHS repeat-associated core domain-containing protein [Cellulophaga sp. E16_2]|uniref:RHS repeat-associated core domain-containing protein n=1 Tax=Cellulophaga sp. E16_2 TaxID=2789297 RepID=UPI001A9108A9|nr:RHS repeat-associated core domain-containing protein [Cellulophaga sp. E16_2]